MNGHVWQPWSPIIFENISLFLLLHNLVRYNFFVFIYKLHFYFISFLNLLLHTLIWYSFFSFPEDFITIALVIAPEFSYIDLHLGEV